MKREGLASCCLLSSMLCTLAALVSRYSLRYRGGSLLLVSSLSYRRCRKGSHYYFNNRPKTRILMLFETWEIGLFLPSFPAGADKLACARQLKKERRDRPRSRDETMRRNWRLEAPLWSLDFAALAAFSSAFRLELYTIFASLLLCFFQLFCYFLLELSDYWWIPLPKRTEMT